MEAALTQAQLKMYVTYVPETGIFLRRVSSGNAKCGERAGTIDGEGRWYIKIRNKKHAAARLAFLYMIGSWPQGQVDHIDGNSLNDAWNNLRDVSPCLNQRNRRLNYNNKSGISGVYWDVAQALWISRVWMNGSYKQLLKTPDFFEACCARKSWESAHNYHPNHGNSSEVACPE